MAEDPALGSRSGLLPPDGVAWPPEPPAPAAVPDAPISLPTVARRPTDSAGDVGDWRAMPIDAPDGYRGSTTAPPPPSRRVDLWSVMSIVLATIGLIPFLLRVPFAPLLALGFGLVGRRVCTADPTRRGRVLATVGAAVGAATLLVVAGAVASGWFTLFDV